MKNEFELNELKNVPPIAAIGTHPQSLFSHGSVENRIELQYGPDRQPWILEKHANMLAISALTSHQQSELSKIPGIQRLPDQVGHGIFKLLCDLSISDMCISCNIDAQQIMVPLYIDENNRVLIPTGEITVRFKDDTPKITIENTLDQYQLTHYKAGRRGFMFVKPKDPFQDLIQISYALQQNENINCAEPDLYKENVYGSVSAGLNVSQPPTIGR